MGKRKSTGKRKRFNVFKRDAFTCQYCGRTPPTVVLVVDHIMPVAAGGGDEDTNLITACETCNQGKADGLLSDVPQPLASGLAKQVEAREQIEAYNKWLLEARKRRETEIREIGVYWCNGVYPHDERGKWIVHESRLRSIGMFAEQLPLARIYQAVDIAFARWESFPNDDHRAWKYFCGVCWRMIRDAEGATPSA